MICPTGHFEMSYAGWITQSVSTKYRIGLCMRHCSLFLAYRNHPGPNCRQIRRRGTLRRMHWLPSRLSHCHLADCKWYMILCSICPATSGIYQRCAIHYDMNVAKFYIFWIVRSPRTGQLSVALSAATPSRWTTLVQRKIPTPTVSFVPFPHDTMNHAKIPPNNQATTTTALTNQRPSPTTSSLSIGIGKLAYVPLLHFPWQGLPFPDISVSVLKEMLREIMP